MKNCFIYIWSNVICTARWALIDGRPYSVAINMRSGSFPTFLLSSCTLLSPAWNWSFPSPANVSTLLWKAALLWPPPRRLPRFLFLRWLLFLPPSPWSAALLPHCFFYHPGLSYIMHGKQTDMSESLKGTAVPSLKLHKPWEAGHRGRQVGVTSQRPLCAAWALLNYSHLCGSKSQHIRRGGINNVPIKNCNYTNIYQLKDFFVIVMYLPFFFFFYTTTYNLIFPTTTYSCIVFKCTNAPFDPFECWPNMWFRLLWGCQYVLLPLSVTLHVNLIYLLNHGGDKLLLWLTLNCIQA